MLKRFLLVLNLLVISFKGNLEILDTNLFNLEAWKGFLLLVPKGTKRWLKICDYYLFEIASQIKQEYEDKKWKEKKNALELLDFVACVHSSVKLKANKKMVHAFTPQIFTQI